MSKLTFRADDELVERVESLDASKSEIMREALRAYLDGLDIPDRTPRERPTGSIDAAIADRVDTMIEERLGAHARDRDVNININLDRDASASDASDPEPDPAARERETADAGSDDRCAQCGEPIDPDHVYCPNCGEKRSRRVFCECGDEIRTDWSFCPSCGRRTPAADVLDRS